MSVTPVLLANGFLSITEYPVSADEAQASPCSIGTVLANMAYYGFVPNIAALDKLRALSQEGLQDFWTRVEPAMSELSGDNRNMGDFVVYKNFPKEVLDMSQAQYWCYQICMYLGAPATWFVQNAEERAPLSEKMRLKTLQLAGPNTLGELCSSLIANKASWTNDQRTNFDFLLSHLEIETLDVRDFGYKGNGVRAVATHMNLVCIVKDATDVLRIAAALSEADATLRNKVKFRKFNRAERRQLLTMLDNSANLEDDMAMRPELFKKLLALLHPGDFKFERVSRAYDRLYKGELTTYSAQLEAALRNKDFTALELVSRRPGEYLRRLHQLYGVFGSDAFNLFATQLAKLSTIQLLKLQGYLATIGEREQLVYAPRGNWYRAQVAKNEKATFAPEDLAALLSEIEAVLAARMAAQFPKGVALDARTKDVKLQSNGQELAPYGRGTVFDIPPEMTYLRTASFWKTNPKDGTIWFDNGWTFHKEDWSGVGSCCWCSTEVAETNGAVFSGDPINSRDLEGRACQMIDLYLDKLQAKGIRYAVWNILAYSGIAFADAGDVLATLQWGVNPEEGALYEPSRAQMVFPLRGNALTKYVAYVDVVARKLVYLDADLGGSVMGASNNIGRISQLMPAVLEHLNAQPSVADLFAAAPKGELPVLFSDEDVSLSDEQPAYVFQTRNAGNSFKQVDLISLL
jgi:hypothetical protein